MFEQLVGGAAVLSQSCVPVMIIWEAPGYHIESRAEKRFENGTFGLQRFFVHTATSLFETFETYLKWTSASVMIFIKQNIKKRIIGSF